MTPGNRQSLPIWIRLARPVVFIVLVVPVCAGVAGAALPAFGYFPALGRNALSMEVWTKLLSMPGFLASTVLSVWVGLASTLIAFLAVMTLLARFHDSRIFWLVRRTLSPLLSVPHAALAIGLAFVISPSGLLFRLISEAAGGLGNPPDILTVHDRYGLALIGGLVIKEAPFIFLMSLASLPQTDHFRMKAIATSLGYSPAISWLKAVLPRLYPQIRLPVFAVLAYSISIVDMAVILGPTTPPTLPVQIVRWMNEPTLDGRFMAGAGALVMIAATAIAMAFWRAGEFLVRAASRLWMESGQRRSGEAIISAFATVSGTIILVFVLLSTVSLLLWGFAESWLNPGPFPDAISFRNWVDRAGEVGPPLLHATIVGLVSAALALCLTVCLLEGHVRSRERLSPALRIVFYVPLVVPQIAFLPGLQILFLSWGLHETFGSLILVHLIFVLPYVYLSLSDPWTHFDDRYRLAALALGASPNRALMKVRLPILLGAVLTALAVGFAISIGQYLPTLLFGAGVYPTITTEAVVLSSSGDRRLIALYALLQGLLPFCGFGLAMSLPSLAHRFRNRFQAA